MLPVVKRNEDDVNVYVYVPQTTAETSNACQANTTNDSYAVTPASKRLRLQADGDLAEDFRIQTTAVEALPYEVNEEDDKLLNIDWNNLPDFSESSKEKLKYENEIMHLKIQVKELQQSLDKKELEVLILTDRNTKLKENLKTAIEKLKAAMHHNENQLNPLPTNSQESMPPSPPTMVKSTSQSTAMGASGTQAHRSLLPQLGLMSKPSFSTATRLSSREIPRPKEYKEKPPPGVFSHEEALLYNMVPLVNGSNVYVYPEHLNSVRKKEKPTFVLRKLLRLFFSDEDLKRSNFSGRSQFGFTQLNRDVTSAILQYCSDPTNFPENDVSYSKLVETINNVCAELRTVRKKPYVRKGRTQGKSPLNTAVLQDTEDSPGNAQVTEEIKDDSMNATPDSEL